MAPDDQPNPPPAGPLGEPPAGGKPVEPAAVTTGSAAAEQSPRTARKLVYLVPAGADDARQDESSPSSAEGGDPAAQARMAGTDRLAERTGLEPTAGGRFTADDINGAADGDNGLDDEAEHRDWAWVEEWRSGQEPTPWASGLVITAFSALVVGVAIWVLCAGLADRPGIAVLVNILVAAGLAPAMWLSRGLPVLRWIAGGALIGVIGGWFAAILMLPLP